MASITAHRGTSVEDCALGDLYEQLREIELSDQRLTRQLDDVECYQRVFKYRDSDDDTYMATGFSREFLDAQHTTLSACQTLQRKFHEMLRKEINIHSRPSLRPLTILDLPYEILVQISKHVKGWHPDPLFAAFMYSQGVSEIKNLRLTCWRFCNASSQFLIPLVRVELNSASVSQLNKISKHPTISQGVRAVKVILDYYDYELANDIALFAEYSAYNLRRHTEFSEYNVLDKTDESVATDLEIIRKSRELENVWMSFAEDTVTLTDNVSALDLLRRAHEEYKSRTADQTQVYENGAFFRSVGTAIGRMPLATRLEFSEWDFQGSRHKRTGSCREGDDDFYLWQMLLPMRWDVGREWALGSPHADVLVDLPIAVHEAGTVLKCLDLQISSLPDRHETLTAAETRKLSMAVQQVTVINIRMRGEHLADSESAHDPAYLEYCRQYIDALSNTDSIEDISLNLQCFTGQDMPLTADIGSLMTFRLWQNLANVTWQDVLLYQMDLERFFRLVHKPLEYLYLESVCLLSGSWAETLEILRAAPLGSRVTLLDPLGAECDDLESEEKARIFGTPNDEVWRKSPAEKYVIGYLRLNPLKADEVDQNGAT